MAVTAEPIPAAAARADSRLPLAWLEIAFGIVLPVVCFVTDFALGIHLIAVAPMAALSFAALGMAALLMSATAWARGDLRDALVGALLVGGCGAVLIGIALSPLSLLALMLLGLGLLGLVPFGTGAIFLLRARKLWRARDAGPASLISLGAAVVIAIPVALQLAELRWLDVRRAEIASADPERVALALRGLNAYPFYLGRAQADICADVVEKNVAAPVIERELIVMLGPNPANACLRGPD
jgi:hypothetical protein